MDGISSVQEQNARNMKDFLELYNKLTEQCFLRCVTNFNNRALTSEEVSGLKDYSRSIQARFMKLCMWIEGIKKIIQNSCVGVCADRYVKYNQKMMFTFMEFQNAKQEVAIKEMERAAAEGRPPNLPGLGPQGMLGGAPAGQTEMMQGNSTDTTTSTTIPDSTLSDPR